MACGISVGYTGRQQKKILVVGCVSGMILQGIVVVFNLSAIAQVVSILPWSQFLLVWLVWSDPFSVIIGCVFLVIFWQSCTWCAGVLQIVHYSMCPTVQNRITTNESLCFKRLTGVCLVPAVIVGVVTKGLMRWRCVLFDSVSIGHLFDILCSYSVCLFLWGWCVFTVVFTVVFFLCYECG